MKRSACPHVVAALALLVLAAACTNDTRTMRCRRVEVGSLGSDNSFRLAVAPEVAAPLDDAADRVEIAVTVIPPVAGTVTLVQSRAGAPSAQWDLALGPVAGMSTRCAVGSTPGASTCKAWIAALPFPMDGIWTLEAGANRVLEVGLAVRSCD